MLGNVNSAEGLETDIIKVLVTRWFQLHHDNDFKENDGQHKSEPANLHRWMAHLLLTTTINIAAGAKVVTFFAQNPSANALPFRAPHNLFMNFELLLQSRFNDINVRLWISSHLPIKLLTHEIRTPWRISLLSSNMKTTKKPSNI